MITENSICPDCGRNDEFILHEDGCPQFGKEVAEYIEKHDAEIATWPEGAREALQHLDAMQAHLFLKQLKLRDLLGKLYDNRCIYMRWTEEDHAIVEAVRKELKR